MSSHNRTRFSHVRRETKVAFAVALLILSLVGAYSYYSSFSRPGPSQPLHLVARRTMSLNGEWKYVVASNYTGRKNGYFLVDYDDSGWRSVYVPWEYASTVDNCTVWFRRRFVVPSELNRSTIRLRFDGVYLISSVWVNGMFLGDHTGYFDPFVFNVTGYLNFGGENVLTVFVYSPVESDLRYKIYVEGVFSDWDCRPYPNWAKDSLSMYGRWFVPGGIWGNVSLLASGPVTIDSVLSSSRIYNASLANVGFNFTLSNYSNRTKDVRVNVSITGYNFALEKAIVKGLLTQLQPHLNQNVQLSVDVNDPKLWWPWDQGYPYLHQANVTVSCDDGISEVYIVKFGIRSVRVDIQKGRWTWFINGRKFFPRGSNYISNYFLIKSDVDWLQRDLELAKEANMDMLRIHAHIEPFTFYDLADEMGILVMQDFALIFAYVDNTYVYAQAEAQIKQMVTELYNHPSIVLWACHNEPPWSSPWMGDLYSRKVNYELDHKLQQIVNALDETRPCIAASGQLDEHVYPGWYGGSWLEYKNYYFGFPNEFGTQAHPNLESPFWSQDFRVTSWPIYEEDQRLKYHDYMPWADGWKNIIGWPSSYPNLATYIRVGQEYQEALLKLAIERFRTCKYSPTGGCLQFLFVDCHPAITWSIVDYYRLPKLAYYAVKNAFNPVHVCIDWRGSYSTTGVYHINYKVGDAFIADLYLVNDYPQVFQNVNLTWQILAQNGAVLYEDSLIVDTPNGDEAALKVATISWTVPSPAGQTYTLTTTLTTQGGEILDTNSFTFTSSS